MKKLFKNNFTLVEVLITLTVVGVVAALTIPMLVANINSRVRAHQKEVIEKRFIDGLNLFNNLENGLSKRYSSTEGFVRGLSAHMKIVQICGNDNLDKCFPYEEINVEDEGAVKISKFKTAGNLQLTDEGFEDTAAFITAAGTPFLISYNQNCNEDPDIELTNIPLCVAGIYDLNGSRRPNKFGVVVDKYGNISSVSDIETFSNARLSKCSLKIDNVCFTAMPSKASPYYMPASLCPSGEPTNPPKEFKDLGIKYCYTGVNDYWAGAVRECGSVSNLVSKAQLMKLAEKLYVDNNGEISVNQKLLSVLGVEIPFTVWTNSELWADRSRVVVFTDTQAYSIDFNSGNYKVLRYNNNSHYTMCVSN